MRKKSNAFSRLPPYSTSVVMMMPSINNSSWSCDLFECIRI